MVEMMIPVLCLSLLQWVLSYNVSPLLSSRGLERKVLEIREEAAIVSLDLVKSGSVQVPSYISRGPVEV